MLEKPTDEEVVALVQRVHGSEAPDPTSLDEEAYFRWTFSDHAVEVFTMGKLPDLDWNLDEAYRLEGISEERLAELQEGEEPTEEEHEALMEILEDEASYDRVMRIHWLRDPTGPTTKPGVFFAGLFGTVNPQGHDTLAIAGPFRTDDAARDFLGSVSEGGNWEWDNAFRSPEARLAEELEPKELTDSV